MSDVPTKLYLAGPMSGLPEYNRPRFNEVAAMLRAQGHDVFNPAENDDGGVIRDRAFYMRLDIPALVASEAIVLLAGWRQSRGASLEVWIGIDLDMPLYTCDTVDGAVLLERLAPPAIEQLPFAD